MRRQGRTFGAISRALDVGKGTIHYIVKDIELTPEQKARITEKRSQKAKREWEERRKRGFKTGWGHLPKEKQEAIKEKISAANKAWHERNPNQWKDAKKSGFMAAGLTYRKDELETKRHLEELFECTFQKAHVNGRFFDFADENHLIEHTRDNTKGVSDAISRFRQAEEIGDARKRIAYVPLSRVGPLRRRRFEALNVELRDVVDLED